MQELLDNNVVYKLELPRSNTPAPGNGWFLPESTGNWQESIGKIRKISGRNTASMFQ
jgi:hypothetical protein